MEGEKRGLCSAQWDFEARSDKTFTRRGQRNVMRGGVSNLIVVKFQ